MYINNDTMKTLLKGEKLEKWQLRILQDRLEKDNERREDAKRRKFARKIDFWGDIVRVFKENRDAYLSPTDIQFALYDRYQSKISNQRISAALYELWMLNEHPGAWAKLYPAEVPQELICLKRVSYDQRPGRRALYYI